MCLLYLKSKVSKNILRLKKNLARSLSRKRVAVCLAIALSDLRPVTSSKRRHKTVCESNVEYCWLILPLLVVGFDGRYPKCAYHIGTDNSNIPQENITAGMFLLYDTFYRNKMKKFTY